MTFKFLSVFKVFKKEFSSDIKWFFDFIIPIQFVFLFLVSLLLYLNYIIFLIMFLLYLLKYICLFLDMLLPEAAFYDYYNQKYNNLWIFITSKLDIEYISYFKDMFLIYSNRKIADFIFPRTEDMDEDDIDWFKRWELRRESWSLKYEDLHTQFYLWLDGLKKEGPRSKYWIAHYYWNYDGYKAQNIWDYISSNSKDYIYILLKLPSLIYFGLVNLKKFTYKYTIPKGYIYEISMSILTSSCYDCFLLLKLQYYKIWKKYYGFFGNIRKVLYSTLILQHLNVDVFNRIVKNVFICFFWLFIIVFFCISYHIIFVLFMHLFFLVLIFILVINLIYYYYYYKLYKLFNHYKHIIGFFLDDILYYFSKQYKLYLTGFFLDDTLIYWSYMWMNYFQIDGIKAILYLLDIRTHKFFAYVYQNKDEFFENLNLLKYVITLFDEESYKDIIAIFYDKKYNKPYKHSKYYKYYEYIKNYRPYHYNYSENYKIYKLIADEKKKKRFYYIYCCKQIVYCIFLYFRRRLYKKFK